MFANPSSEPNVGSASATGTETPAFGFAGIRSFEGIDPEDQLAWSEAADSHLLRLVMCAAFATLTLALVSSLA